MQTHEIILATLITACVSWTIAQEEIFREVRQWLQQTSTGASWWIRKVAYLPTCHYCFSHWVAAWAVWTLGLSWVYWLPIVWGANHSMTLYGLLRQQQKKCSWEAMIKEQQCEASRSR